MASKFEVCAEDDPKRCQSNIRTGQCHYKAVEGSQYCLRHGGHVAEKQRSSENVSNYRLSVWQTRLNEMRNSEGIKSLRDEIGLSRIVIENIVNLCKTDNDLLMHHSKLNQSVLTMEKLITSCQRLEERNSYLLDKDQLFVIVDSITKIISEYVTDPDKMSEIGTKIYDTISRSASRTDERESAS